MENSYQKRKARMLAAVLISASCASTVTLAELPELAANLTHREWISVAMQAGVAVPDSRAKALTVAYLLSV